MKRVSGNLRQRGKKGTYYLRYVIDGKAFDVCTGLTNKKDAQAFAKDHLAAFNLTKRGEHLQAVAAQLADNETKIALEDEKKNPPPPVPAVWNRFLANPTRPDSGASTLKQYRSEWNRFVKWLGDNHPAITDLRLVKADMAGDYAKKLVEDKVSASTFNQHRNLLRMVWRVMADECRLTTNPWDKINPRKLHALDTRKRALTPAQFESLLAVAESSPDLKDLFTLLAWTGLRLADAVLMQWGAVDFSQRVISIVPQKTARRQGKQVHIPLFPAALEVLNQRQAGKVLNPRGYVFPALVRQYNQDASALSKNITDIFEKAGIVTTEARAERGRAVVVYGAHSLRHFFVTQATSAGMPAAMIKSITGHATDEMLEHYQQIGVDLAADMAARVLGQSPAQIPETAESAAPTAEKLAGELANVKARVRAVADGLSAKTWKAAQAELLTLAGAA